MLILFIRFKEIICYISIEIVLKEGFDRRNLKYKDKNNSIISN